MLSLFSAKSFRFIYFCDGFERSIKKSARTVCKTNLIWFLNDEAHAMDWFLYSLLFSVKSHSNDTTPNDTFNCELYISTTGEPNSVKDQRTISLTQSSLYAFVVQKTDFFAFNAILIIVGIGRNAEIERIKWSEQANFALFGEMNMCSLCSLANDEFSAYRCARYFRILKWELTGDVVYARFQLKVCETKEAVHCNGIRCCPFFQFSRQFSRDFYSSFLNSVSICHFTRRVNGLHEWRQFWAIPF